MSWLLTAVKLVQMMSFNFVETFTCPHGPLAVVPVVVNAGAALFPVILAAITTFVALLFKPRELMRVCREKPLVPIVVMGLAGAFGALLMFWPTGGGASDAAPAGRRGDVARTPASGTNNAGGGAVYVDWTRVALERIAARERLAMADATRETTPTAFVATKSGGELGGDLEKETAFIFRGGNQRLGVLGDVPPVGLQRVWHHYPTWIDESGVESEDTEAMILSSAAVYGDRVYGASCLLDPPDTYGAIFCLDAKSGKQIWSLDRDGDVDFKGFFSSPAISADGRYLVIGQGLHPDSHCTLICVDTEAGRVHWTLPTTLHLESSPVIDGDTVYIGAGAIEDPASHKALSHSGYVLAARLSDGEQLWQHDVADPESSPVVSDGVLYIGSGFNGKAIVALSTDPNVAADARELWRTPTPYPITGAITLHGDLVIAGGGNGDFVYRDPNPAGVVMALDSKTGEVVWQSEMPDAVLGAVAAGKYLVCGVANGEVMALDPDGGKPVWASRISGVAPVLAAPSVTDREVFAVSQDGYLARFNLETGEEIENLYINSEEKPGSQGLSISSPLVVDGRLFVGSETGGLRAYAGGLAK
ncbi:outer membrane protein assembly factor BamB family protein [Aporhodopirellula aestuarii]|uniref:PQQ-binding-like beta-propeller repeat protein n=1 Tax=Aporhodopirellula aestuarii TaxID=2950107 RepID=A0ABT0UB38_9BACT|nr:PQQ-binding-like beta-propeller repeat protein [Aporhodopirellula aestuarii]MCM2373735.1 PQQ-binding-like beta-propeller repeat protein [Aporhodopirellula aestuarii]